MTRGTAYNTTMQHKGIPSLEIFLLCIYVPTCVVGLTGNGLVIFLTCCRMKTTVNSIWFLNLAIADFIFISSSCIISGLGQLHCHYIICVFLMSLNLFASISFLVVISLDRCLCTWMVVWPKNKRTLLKARITCVIVWVSSIGCSIPVFEADKFSFRFLIACNFTVGFLMPFLIIASSYIANGVRIKRFKRGKQFRSYRVIITVTLAFFICCFPHKHCVFYFLTALENNWSISDVSVTAMSVSVYLVHLNSCLNPILYVFMCDEYKKKLKQSLLLVLETAFAEDHLDFKAAGKRQAAQ